MATLGSFKPYSTPQIASLEAQLADTRSSDGKLSTPTKRGIRGIGGLLLFGGVSLLAAALGARINAKRSNRLWYRLLRKSELTPPDRTFSIVWPILYSMSAFSAWRVARAPSSPARTRALGWWGVQIACNAVWTPLFFGAHRPRLALVDLSANAASLGAYARAARDVDRTAALLVTPYLGWLSFAALLNTKVITKNTGPTAWLLRG
ncbi:MAG TPA: TspO/MBR family protein [Polyangiaceae bacterium]|nr:TspO/MBR family protein [Polyangiaceae bacterium]